MCLLALAVGVSPVLAEHQHDSGAAPAKAAPAPPETGGPQPCMPGRGPMGHGMMGQGMVGMPCHMPCPMMGCGGMAHPPGMAMMHHMMHQGMGGQTDPASIGLAEAMGAANMDAKTFGRMLEMRGEILKAIGEIMLKYGRRMEEEK
jgi:hypothetical protein